MKSPLPPPSPVRPSAPSPVPPAAGAPPSPLAPGLPSAISPGENRSASTSPRKETARIGPTPDTPMKATVKLSGPAPSSAPPAGVIRTAPPPAVATTPPAGLVESVPMPLCWALVGISALTLLLQLWTYFS
jgi:hypothetical protein